MPGELNSNVNAKLVKKPICKKKNKKSRANSQSEGECVTPEQNYSLSIVFTMYGVLLMFYCLKANSVRLSVGSMF